MPRRIHYLNVKNGACSIIQHGSGSVSVIDVNCATAPTLNRVVKMSTYARESWEPVPGNFQQKYEHDNPIEYLQKIAVDKIFRFILTHPDMDHLGGVRDLFNAFDVWNFWDTANTKEFPPHNFDSRPAQGADWEFYKNLRDTSPSSSPKRLVYYSGKRARVFQGRGSQNTRTDARAGASGQQAQ